MFLCLFILCARIILDKTVIELAFKNIISKKLGSDSIHAKAEHIKKYVKAEEDAVDKDGWFDSGDISSIDPDGYMSIVDREKDVIKSGGEWISSIDVENAVASHPDVMQTAVVGIPHPKWDERPLLFVVSNSGNEINREELDELMLKKFEKWQLPDQVVFLKELPIGATGKVKKIDLREEYKEHYM